VIAMLKEKLQVWRWLVIGVLFAIATLYKPVAITFAAFLSCFYLLVNIRHRNNRKIAFFQISYQKYTMQAKI